MGAAAGDPAADPAAGARARRELSAAVLLCLLGAFVVLVGVGRGWAEVEVSGPLTGPQAVQVPGSELAGGVRGLGLVGLAGVVALAATRRWGRAVVGLLLLLAGLGVVAAVVGTDLERGARRSDAVVAAGGGAADAVSTTAWPWLTAAGGALVLLAGLLTVARGRGWPALGRRYEAPAAGAPAAEPAPDGPARTERGLWEALDRGEDPTAGDGTTDPRGG